MRKILWGLVFLSTAYLFFGKIIPLFYNKGFPLEVHFLDVGQGDAILINYLRTYQVLIDGGPSGNKLLKKLGEKMPWGDRRIEIVVLTHPDKDHMTGLIELLDNFQVDLFLTNGQKTDSQDFLVLEEKIAKRGIKKETLYAGSHWEIGQRLNFLVLNPDGDDAQNLGEKNSQSVILRVTFGDNSFFLAADAEKETEKDLLSDGEVVDVDWLKVAHHGSKNATTEEFLAVARPEKAIISVGKNLYGHPTKETLERLEKSGAEVFRTDKLGTISVVCPGLDQVCWIQHKKERLFNFNAFFY